MTTLEEIFVERGWEKGWEIGYREGFRQGFEEEQIRIAKKLLEISTFISGNELLEFVHKTTGLPMDKIKLLAIGCS